MSRSYKKNKREKDFYKEDIYDTNEYIPNKRPKYREVRNKLNKEDVSHVPNSLVRKVKQYDYY